jgi:hypothetical protein
MKGLLSLELSSTQGTIVTATSELGGLEIGGSPWDQDWLSS